MTRVVGFLVDGVRVLALLVLLAAVRGYQLFVSPLLPRVCRYQPTCSEYARLAVLRYGPLKGAYKALRRVLRCHPWSRGGWDPP